jgi:hypothetical protein
MTFGMNRQKYTKNKRQKIEVYLKQEPEYDIQHEQREDKGPSKIRDRR